MSIKDEFWEDHHKDCPWYHDCPWDNIFNGRCEGQVTYNGHVNDPRYDICQQETCPIFFWIVRLHEHRPNVYSKEV